MEIGSRARTQARSPFRWIETAVPGVAWKHVGQTIPAVTLGIWGAQLVQFIAGIYLQKHRRCWSILRIIRLVDRDTEIVSSQFQASAWPYGELVTILPDSAVEAFRSFTRAIRKYRCRCIACIRGSDRTQSFDGVLNRLGTFKRLLGRLRAITNDCAKRITNTFELAALYQRASALD